MFVVVCYDIPDDRRRDRVYRLLKDYGTPVQRSVFECELKEKQYRQMRRELQAVLDPQEDNVRFYRLCRACRDEVETVGEVPVTVDPLFYFI